MIAEAPFMCAYCAFFAFIFAALLGFPLAGKLAPKATDGGGKNKIYCAFFALCFAAERLMNRNIVYAAMTEISIIAVR